MAEKSLSLDKLSKRLTTFRDSWYEVVQKCEALVEYSSYPDAGITKPLREISAGIKKSIVELKELGPQIKYYIPELRGEIDKSTSKILQSLEEFSIAVERDLEKLAFLVKDIELVEKKYRDAESRAREACTKYFDRENEYAQRVRSIEEQAKKEISKARTKFIQKVSAIAEGYDIVIKGNGEEKIGVDALFEKLVEKPKDIANIELVPKSLGVLDSIRGGAMANKEAKVSVLKYVSQEALEEVIPIKEKEREQMSGLESEYRHLEKLEKECEKLEEKRKRLERPRLELRDEINKIKETQDTYAKKIDEINKGIKGYFTLVREIEKLKIEEPEVYESEALDLQEELRELLENKKRLEEIEKERNSLKMKIERLELKIQKHMEQKR